ncbi:DUF1543 domain-containing protein [Ascidiimonas aurantiaca]|uniref:DUF1543 domain-containing protein n=1 Tax=Ascidiimonas aurantiaca TaxID=1685432 RepID=UPI0030ECEAB8
MNEKLFALYLGGRAPGSNIELHDVVFVTGKKIEDTYTQILDKWFGPADKVHIDSWMELDVIDGYRVTLSHKPYEGPEKLYFINLGAYRPGEFTEHHAITFLVAKTPEEVKKRAKAQLLKGYDSVHKDDLYAIDDCLEIKKTNSYYVHLTPCDQKANLVPNNGYYVLPRKIVKEYIENTVSQ